MTWAVDLNSGGAALLIALLVEREQRLLYITGRTVNRAAGGYRGEGKTDARDAAIIADQARMRGDLQPLRPGDQIAVDLRILTARRADLVADRTRAINRLRAQLLEICPALERVADPTRQGWLVLLTGYQSPAAIRRLGVRRLEHWLRARGVRGAAALAAKAVDAAAAQTITLPGERLAATIVAQQAKGVMTLDEEISEIETLLVPKTVSPYATCVYSWMSPPRRSRRRTRTLPPASDSALPSGGACASVR